MCSVLDVGLRHDGDKVFEVLEGWKSKTYLIFV